MPDFVNPTTLALAPSVNDMPAPWVVIARADLLTAALIPQHYRKWTGTAVAEMSAGEKATVDAAIVAQELADRVTRFDAMSPLGVMRAVTKPATTTRTGTTVLANDPHLTFPVLAAAKYAFEFRVFFDTTAAADFRLAMSGPASPAGLRFARYAIAPGASALSAIGVSTAFGGAGIGITGTGTAGGYAWGHGILSNGANAGNVAVQWAQNTSDAGNTSVLEGSMFWWTRIG